MVWLSPKPPKTSYVHYERRLIVMKYVLHARKISNEFRMTYYKHGRIALEGVLLMLCSYLSAMAV